MSKHRSFGPRQAPPTGTVSTGPSGIGAEVDQLVLFLGVEEVAVFEVASS